MFFLHIHITWQFIVLQCIWLRTNFYVKLPLSSHLELIKCIICNLNCFFSYKDVYFSDFNLTEFNMFSFSGFRKCTFLWCSCTWTNIKTSSWNCWCQFTFSIKRLLLFNNCSDMYYIKIVVCTLYIFYNILLEFFISVDIWMKW